MSPTAGSSAGNGAGGGSAEAGVSIPGGGTAATSAATAVVVPIPQNASTALSSIPTRTTLPDEIVRHDISDEELGMLSEGTKSAARDMLLMFIGALLGALPSFFKAWGEVTGAKPEAVTGERAAALAIPVAALTAVVVTGILLISNRKGGVKGLAASIRARTQSRKL